MTEKENKIIKNNYNNNTKNKMIKFRDKILKNSY